MHRFASIILLQQLQTEPSINRRTGLLCPVLSPGALAFITRVLEPVWAPVSAAIKPCGLSLKRFQDRCGPEHILVLREVIGFKPYVPEWFGGLTAALDETEDQNVVLRKWVWKLALCVQDPPDMNANSLLIPATISSGFHTTEVLPWANTHVCPDTLPTGTHQPGYALAWTALAIPGGQ
ncbi:hypothetical protein Q9966_013586 [Columba livia]|nr:hypothetical protein Q9966_013586 [Columba livia]